MDETGLDQDACYRAVVTRDARFDGRFFGCVKTTGIYCRPVCPARTPRRENMRFVATAAAAEEAGFRACLRCRPETAPDFSSWRGWQEPRGGAWRGTSNTVSRALALIEAGALDAGSADDLAARLGVGERHLRRLFRQHLGAAPVSVAQTRRVLLAKALIQETDLPMAQVALAAGFGSVRRFNETFQALYRRPPGELRRRAERAAGPDVRLSLPYRPPYDWDGLLQTLAARGDAVADGRWSRALDPVVDGAEGSVTVARGAPGRLSVTVQASDLRALPGVLARVRRVFDLSADPDAIARDLSADPVLAPLVATRPGLRLAGDWIDEGEDAPSDRAPDGWSVQMQARVERWRPWRAYAAAHLAAAGIEIEETKDAA
ncbi:MAG: DNA-3-methyladenine glycosylase 2 family protein [Brevundimonas sp.]|uniref:bifunctional transcriptional activator/DNA repair enzyme AdaA n=1 Tax=Brevundimonas sp. TaxID=1871086 RepID=UPI0025C0B71F|nr:Ada metal-binding domain-containing protein [Brevundimonas sp.]MBX3478371.1 DNA-3-methyladenine glycosylase 2 family protein [Brevundimonas sp.]